MKYMHFFLVLMVLVAACSQTSEKDKEVSPEQKYLKLSPNTLITLEPSDKAGMQNVKVNYQVEKFDTSTGTRILTNMFYNPVANTFKEMPNVDTIEIQIREKSTLVGIFRINREELEQVQKAPGNAIDYFPKFLELDDKFMVEMNLKSIAQNAENVVIKRTFDEEDDSSIMNISFNLKRQQLTKSYQQNPLDDISIFENLIANIVKTTFETDEDISAVYVSADLSEYDPRWNSTKRIADFSMERPEFEEIVEKWDDLRYNIYDKIRYEPIFLADYKAQSTVVSMTFEDTADVQLYYDEEFKDIDTSMDIITTDAETLLEQFFNKYDVKTVVLHFKVKVPAREDDVSSDGIHYIVDDFLVVTAYRNIYEGLDTEELAPIQTLYNFELEWNDRAPDMMIRANLFENSHNFRSIEFGSAQTEVTITLDSCIFLQDRQLRPKIQAVQRAISRDDYDKSLEDEVYDLMYESAKKLVFEIHPPFLETVTINLERVYRDTTGQEIDVKELGTITFDKEEEAMYWFQTENPQDLEWIIEADEDLDIDDDEVLCQT